MSQGAISGKIVIGCFMIIWCLTAFGMGYFALQMSAPFFFPLIAFGMGAFGVVFCLAIIFTKKQKDLPIQRCQTYSYDHEPQTGGSVSHGHSSSRRERKSIYQVPSRCPSCAASISTEEVDWVGPLQAKCPYCMATIDVEERSL
ncbi:MAG: hypothetical protein JW779_10860 [Candidatus Thorarchaeota archaeon]|nr:hypothetical protein [Candidatus Thorarchaeota archaeon]